VAARTYAFFDTAVTVESTDDEALSWLDEMLGPGFECPAEPRELEVTVRHAPYAAGVPIVAFPSPAERVPFIRLDSRTVELPAVRSGSRVVLDDAAEGCRCTIDGLRVTIEARDNPGRLVLMRVVREIAVEHERRHARAAELHAAAFELGGEAIAVTGLKGAGKTTLLLHALARASARLVANDHVLVDAWTGRWRVTGVPAVIRIHPRTACDFPALAASVPSSGPTNLTLHEAREAIRAVGPAGAGTELRVTPAQLTRILGCAPRATAPLRAIVLPEIGAAGDAPHLARLASEDAADRLRATAYGGRGHEPVSTVFTELVARACPGAQADAVLQRAAADLLARLGSEVPCYRLTPGRDPGVAVDLLLRDVLG
jgi:hypothetical protein